MNGIITPSLERVAFIFHQICIGCMILLSLSQLVNNVYNKVKKKQLNEKFFLEWTMSMEKISQSMEAEREKGEEA